MRQERLVHGELAEVLRQGKKEKKDLISILQEIQEELGFLSRQAMAEVAQFFKIPKITVYSVATFYDQFRFKPMGRHHFQVCTGTACHLKGGRAILEQFERQLDITVGETSQDGSFSLERVACMGCCTKSPVVRMGDKLYPQMTPFKVEEILVPLRESTKGWSE